MSGQGFLETVARQGRAGVEVAHRPWPLAGRAVGAGADARGTCSSPTGRSRSTSSRGCSRPSLPLDTFDGEAWLGLVAVPARRHLRLRGLPPVPGLSSFAAARRPHLRHARRPARRLALLARRRRTRCSSRRRKRDSPAAGVPRAHPRRGAATATRGSRPSATGSRSARATAPAGETFTAEPGSLEHFLDRALLPLHRRRRAPLPRGAPPRAVAAAARPRRRSRRPRSSPLALEGSRICAIAAAQDVLVWPLEELVSPQRRTALVSVVAAAALVALKLVGRARRRTASGSSPRRSTPAPTWSPRCSPSSRSASPSGRPTRRTSTGTARPSTSPRSPRQSFLCAREHLHRRARARAAVRAGGTPRSTRRWYVFATVAVVIAIDAAATSVSWRAAPAHGERRARLERAPLRERPRRLARRARRAAARPRRATRTATRSRRCSSPCSFSPRPRG